MKRSMHNNNWFTHLYGLLSPLIICLLEEAAMYEFFHEACQQIYELGDYYNDSGASTEMLISGTYWI